MDDGTYKKILEPTTALQGVDKATINAGTSE